MSRTSSLASRLKTNLIYHRLYNDPPSRSELAVSQITDEGLPPLKPPPLPPSPYKSSMPQADGPSTPLEQSSPANSPPGNLVWNAPANLPLPTSTTRKLRLVCISDTHNSSPLDGAFRIPNGDILIHAGDMTNQASFPELNRTIKWLCAEPHEFKIVIAGT